MKKKLGLSLKGAMSGHFAQDVVSSSWTLGKALIVSIQLGGRCMGTSTDNGVVDCKGEVFGYPRLFVVNGASTPHAIRMNPSYTIAALADRMADLISSEVAITTEQRKVEKDEFVSA